MTQEEMQKYESGFNEGVLFATQIAMNHNCVPRGIAERYTDSELKEVLRQLKLKADF